MLETRSCESVFFRPVGKNTRQDFELFSQLGQLASGRLEAKCVFPTGSVFSDRSRLAQVFYCVSRFSRPRPVGKKHPPVFRINFPARRAGFGPAEGRTFFSDRFVFTTGRKKQIHVYLRTLHFAFRTLHLYFTRNEQQARPQVR